MFLLNGSLLKGRSGLNVLFKRALAAAFLFFTAVAAHAGIINGTVTDTSGATVKGASIVLFSSGKYVSTTVSTADGSYQFVTGRAGRFTVFITAPGFHQLEVPAFYAGPGDSVERNLVMEPEWVHQSIVVTATGTPTPQQQTPTETTVLDLLDLARREDFISVLRLQPGAVVVQAGQRGSQTSLFLRGADSNAARILMDGVTVDEIGGIFDFGNTSTTGVQTRPAAY
jgi:vitamin B12 transporter